MQKELQSRTPILTIGRVRRKKDDVVDVVECDDWNRVDRLLSAPFEARWPGTRGARKSTWESGSGEISKYSTAKDTDEREKLQDFSVLLSELTMEMQHSYNAC